MGDYTYTDLNGTVHHESTAVPLIGSRRATYDARLDPWQAVRNLLTCPHCGMIGRHRERGNPKLSFQKLLDRGIDGPLECFSCHDWSVAGTFLLDGHRYAPGERVPCPERLRSGRQAPEEER